MADFYEMDFIEHIVILVKVAECKILNWMIKAFAGVCLSMSIRLLRPCFNKGKASSPCYNFLLYLFHKIWMIIKVI